MSTQSSKQPRHKSDSTWLRDAGYTGLPQFMIDYGLKFPSEIDDAKRLIDSFRDDDQAKWNEQALST